jgi:hypothetical protein
VASELLPANGIIKGFDELPEANGRYELVMLAPLLAELQAALQHSQRLSIENVWACTVRVLARIEASVQLVQVADAQGRARELLPNTPWPTLRQRPNEPLIFTFEISGPLHFVGGCVFTPDILEPRS